MSDVLNDVRRDQYATVIREMIRHENDVTNHRLMWLLIGQGFIATAFVSVTTQNALTAVVLLRGGILVALSAFVMLYKSYQARGYLDFLGGKAKQGMLREEHLPFVGWPRRRIQGWRKAVWVCPWFGRGGDVRLLRRPGLVAAPRGMPEFAPGRIGLTPPARVPQGGRERSRVPSGRHRSSGPDPVE